MVDSMNARRGAANYNNKMTNVDFRNVKKELKDKILTNTENATSDYFQYFDEIDPKRMNDKQQYFLNIAAKVANGSDMNHKHGAILVHKKNIIATGYNHYNNNLSIHAEVAAISQLKGKDKKILSECELYVVRIGPGRFYDQLKYSKPCYNCQKFISKKCIKKIYYSTNYDYDVTIANYLESVRNECCNHTANDCITM